MVVLWQICQNPVAISCRDVVIPNSQRVIARASGRSSNPQHLNRNAGLGVTGSPACAGDDMQVMQLFPNAARAAASSRNQLQRGELLAAWQPGRRVRKILDDFYESRVPEGATDGEARLAG